MDYCHRWETWSYLTSKLRTWWRELGPNVFSSNIFTSGSGMFLPWWQVQVNIFKVYVLTWHPFAAFKCHCYLWWWSPSNVLKIYVTDLHSRWCLHIVTKNIFSKLETKTINLKMSLYLKLTMEVQDVKGQYVWSIIMGLVTLFMTMFSNVILVTALLPGEFSHVLILMPFVVPVMVQSLTKSPLTSPSFRYLPKLPTLSHLTI